MRILARRFVASLTALAVAASPSAASAEAYYYRHSSSPLAYLPDADPNAAVSPFVTGNGDVQVQAPLKVRARVGVPFRLALISPTAVSWRVSGGALPAGLNIGQDGVLFGNPQAVQTATDVVIEVKDAAGKFGTTRPMTVDVRPVPIVTVKVAQASLASGQATPTVYSAANETYGTVIWGTSGPLPPGLQIDAKNGTITGSPEVPGTYPGIRVSALDADGAQGFSDPFSLTVTSALSVSGYKPAALARLGYAYRSATPVVQGKTGSLLFTPAPSSAPLPAGLTLDQSTGVIQGTPTQAVSSAPIIVRVEDLTTGARAGASFPLTVAPQPTVSLASSSYGARSGQTFSIKPSVANILGTPSWSYEGALPNGVTVGTDGSITGSSTAVGSSSGLKLKVVDLFDGATGVSGLVSLSLFPAVAVGAVSAPDAIVGQAFELLPPSVSGIKGTTSWKLAGTLPDGLKVDPADSAIRGVPTTVGTSGPLTYTATDSFDGSSAPSAAFTVAVKASAGPLAMVAVPTPLTATVTQEFTYLPHVNGGKAPVQWDISGYLPGWASFDPTTGKLHGYPDAPSNVTGLVFRASDAAGAVVQSSPFSIVTSPLGALALNVPDATAMAGQQFTSQAPYVQNAVGPVTYALASGTLPDNTTVSPTTGSLTGTPTIIGSYPGIVLKVTDSTNAVATSPAFTVNVQSISGANAAMASMPSAPSGTVGQLFSAVPTATGFGSGIKWETAAGTLPSWATLNQATGAITGTPTATGSFPGISLKVSDSTGRAARTNLFTVSVLDGLSLQATMSSQIAKVGSYFSGQPSVAGAKGTTTWTVTQGTLPPGLSPNGSTGAITGIPSTAGTYPGIVLHVRDGSDAVADTQPFTLTVQPAPLTVNPPANLSLITGSSFSGAFTASGGTGAVTWSYSGTLPPGLTFDKASGTLLGKPTQVGQFQGIVFSAAAANGATGSTNPMTLTVSPPSPPVALAVTVPSALKASYNVPFASPKPGVVGAKGTPRFSIAQGTKPAWATFDPTTGILSGTPDNINPVSGLVIKVEDDVASDTTDPFGITIDRQPLGASVASTIPTFRIGDTYATSAPTVRNPVGAVSWASNSLPPGMSLDPQTGIIGGSPTTAGTYPGISLTVTDSANAAINLASFTITVVPPAAITDNPGTLYGRGSTAFTYNPAWVGLIGSQNWVLAPGSAALPAWATLSSATGAITGYPNAVATSGNIQLKVTDSTGRSVTTQQFRIAANGNLAVSPAAATMTARVNKAFTGTFNYSGNAGHLTWSLGQGTLPSTMAVDRLTGAITGTPTETGTYVATLRAADVDGSAKETASFTINVLGAATVSAPSVTVRANAPFSSPATAASARGAQTWRSTGTALPAWATLNGSNGTISGTGGTAGTVVNGIVLQMTDADGAVASTDPFSITVTPGISITGIQDTPYVVRANQPMAPVVVGVTNAQRATTWSVASGSLPAGVGYVDATTSFSGTPTTVGTTSATMRATDTLDNATTTKLIQFTVVAGLGVTGNGGASTHTGVQFTTAPFGITGQRGTSVTWSLSSGTLPAWATLDPATGLISGNAPDGSSSVIGLVLQATDSLDGSTALSKSFAINVLPPLVVSDMATAYLARFSTPYQSAPPSALNASGTVTWAWAPGSAAPSWATVDPATGRITGTPDTVAATPNLRLQATDTASGGTALSVPFTLTVASTPTLSYRKTDWKQRVGDAVSIAPTVNGLAGTPTWSIQVNSGALPAGLRFDPTSGAVVGSATGAGTATFVVSLTDSLSAPDQPAATTQQATLTVSPALSLTGIAASYTAHVGVFFQGDTPTLNGAVPGNAVSYTLSAPVATGINLDPTTGILTGSPTAARTPTNIDLVATDAFDGRTAKATFAFTAIAQGTILNIRSFTVPKGSNASGSTFTPVVTYTSGKGAPTWSLASGTLQNGLSVDSATGRIVGIPDASLAVGNSAVVSIRATDADGSVSATSSTFGVTIGAAFATNPVAAQSWRVGTPVVLQFDTVGSATNDAPTWTVVPGTLPDGMTLSPTGRLTGSPNVDGSFQPQFVATDASGATAQLTFSATSRLALTIGYGADTLRASPGDTVSWPPSVVGGYGTLTFTPTVKSGALPTGVTVKADGTVSGTVAAQGTAGAQAVSSMSVKVTDSADGAVAEALFGVDTGKTFGIGTPVAFTARKGTLYTWRLPTVTGATGPVTWTVSAGALPGGMNIDAANNVISGVPSANGSFPFTLKAVQGTSSATTNVTATVNVPFVYPTIPDQTILANAIYGTQNLAPNHFRLPAPTGYLGTPTQTVTPAIPAVTWSTAAYQGRTCGYYSCTDYTNYTADQLQINGQRVAGVVEGVVMKAVDPVDGAVAYSNPFNISFVGITPPPTANARVGVFFQGPAPAATGYPGPVTWSISPLPAGMNLDPATGILSGTPQVAEGKTLYLTAASGSNSTYTSYTWSAAAGMTLPTIADVTIRSGTTYGNYNQATNFAFGQVGNSRGGALSATFNATVPGITLSNYVYAYTYTNPYYPYNTTWQYTPDYTYYQLNGTPAAGTYPNLVLSLTDPSDGSTVQSNPFNMYVLTLNAPPEQRLRVGKDVTFPAPVYSGFPGPVTFAATNLPAGLGIDAATGVISGRPSTATSASVTITAVSGGARLTAAFNVYVVAPLQISAPGDITLVAATGYGNLGTGAAYLPGPGATNLQQNSTWSMVGATGFNAITYSARNCCDSRGQPWFSTSQPSSVFSGSSAANIYKDVTVSVTDSWDNATATTSPFNVYVVSITPPATQKMRVGTFSTLDAPIPNGFPGTPSWSADSALPAGLTLDGPSGKVSGTPSTAGSFGITLRASSGPATMTTTYTVVINSDITAPYIPDQTVFVGTRYSATGSYAITTGFTSKVSGLTFKTNKDISPYSVVTMTDGASVALSGTATQTGSFTGVTVTGTDSYDGSSETSNPFNIYVVQLTPPNPQKLRIGTQATIPSPTPSGFPGPITYSVAQGLPDGMQLQADGSIVGTPTTAGSYTTVLRVTAGSATTTTQFTVTVSPRLVQPFQPDLAFQIGTAANQSLTPPTGYVSTPTFSSASALGPYGLQPAAATSAVLRGTATQVQAYPGIVVTATDPFDNVTASSPPFNVYAVDLQVPPAQKLRVNQAYSLPAPTVNGLPTGNGIVWSVSGQPAGMDVNPATGVVSGKPTSVGSTTMTLTAKAGPYGASLSKTVPVQVAAQLTWSNIAPASLQVGSAQTYSFPAVANIQGTATYTTANPVSPLTPGGTGSVGNLSGTLPAGWPGLTGVVVTVTDGWDGSSLTSNAFDVYGLTFSYAGTVKGRSGTPLAMTGPSTSGFPGSITYTQVSGTAQAGLSLNSATGVYQTTPTAVGTSNMTVKATSGSATLNANVTLDVRGALNIPTITDKVVRGDTSSTALATVGNSYGTLSVTTSPSVSPYGITVTGGALSLSGTSTTTGPISNVVLTVTDSWDGTSVNSNPFTVYVVTPKPGSLPATYKAGTVYQGGPASAPGMPGTPTWSLRSGTFLPAGLTVNASTGTIEGSSSVTGTRSVILQVTSTVNGVTYSLTTDPFNVTVSP